MATPQEILAQIPVAKVLGPILLGVSLNAFFYGFSVLQFIQYRTRLYHDDRATQLLVLWVFSLDTVHSAAMCWMLWAYVVENYINPAFLVTAPWPIIATPFFIVFTVAPVQFYLAFRIKDLSNNPFLFWFIMLLTLANNVMGLVNGSLAPSHADVNAFKTLLPFVVSWLTLVFFDDVLISGILVYYMVRRKSTFRLHQRFRDRVAHAFIESSALPSLFALADLISYSIVPSINYHLIFSLPLGRVYTCTLMAMLNSRLQLREDEAEGIIPKASSFPPRIDIAKAFRSQSAPVNVNVEVAVERQIEENNHTPRKPLKKSLRSMTRTESPQHERKDASHFD